MQAPVEQFKSYLKVIGRGQRAGRTLSECEAYHAMQLLLDGKVSAEQRGAFLMLLRVREESVDELAGFVRACRKSSNADLAALQVDLDVPCYAGKRRHLPWLLLASLLLAENGKRVFLHGTHEPESKRLYMDEVLGDFGIQAATTVDELDGQLSRLGVGYMSLAAINPALHDLIQLRALLGLRSCANTLARMLNPGNAPVSVQGVYHRHVDERHVQVGALLNESCVVAFRGEGGENECNPERRTALHHARFGKISVYQQPVLRPEWATKPRTLDTQRLSQLWCGDIKDDYALQATLGTAAIWLMGLEQLSWEQAYKLAGDWWQLRSRVWPLTNEQPMSMTRTSA